MATKQPPIVHPKAPQTGKGVVQMPPNSGAIGPSNHVPVTGKS
jgi:hypothetical protein